MKNMKEKLNKFLIKEQECSLLPYGCYPGSRPIDQLIKNGIIIIDKPRGPICFQIDRWIKQILNIKKASHGGTLDPYTSGVLVIALENATKLMPVLLKSKKEYITVMHLHHEVSKQKIKKVCNEFLGKIKQIPPKKSAVARKEREREIYYLEIIEIEGRNVLMRVGCEAGTYIRKLCDSIGKKLGCGAHMAELRRTKSGIFTEDKAVKLQDLVDAMAVYRESSNENYLREIILPQELVMETTGNVLIKDSAIDTVCNGAPLAVGGLIWIKEGIEKGDLVGIFSLKGELVAFGKAFMSSEEMFKSKKGLAVKTDKVLMARGTYPKMIK